MDKTSIGDRMKSYESKERFMPLLPIIARLDGKNFSKFTKGLDRPYDKRFSDAMVETSKYLVEQTGAAISYTQSDEITLVFYSDSHDSQVFFDGKVQKMVSVLASMATAKFNQLRQELFPGHKPDVLALFDCRCYQVPNKVEAANAVLWRNHDATKNAISMAAHHHFGHKRTLNISGKEKQEMLWQEANVNFNDYPPYFKRGVFVRRQVVDVELTPDELAVIPENRRPDGPVKRTRMAEIDMPIFSKVTNRVEVIFNGEDPEICQEDND